jgi:hypothetical protein
VSDDNWLPITPAALSLFISPVVMFMFPKLIVEDPVVSVCKSMFLIIWVIKKCKALGISDYKLAGHLAGAETAHTTELKTQIKILQ